MLKTLAAALVAASVLIAPIAASAETPAAKPATTTTKVVKVKGHKHFARHHKHRKHVKHVRGHNKTVVTKKTRHGKIVTAHKRNHVAAKVVKAPKAAN